MTTDETTAETDARLWALRTLNLDSTHRWSDIPSILKLVTQSDYVVSEELVDAAQLVGGPVHERCASIIKQSSLAEQHERCLKRIASFRSQYFDCPCSQRARLWEALVEDCRPFPELAAQVARLKSGLQVNFPSNDMALESMALLQTCRDVYLATPIQAARLRQSTFQQWRADNDRMEDIVDDLLETQGDFMQAIAPWVDHFGEQLFWDRRDRGQMRPVIQPSPEYAAQPTEWAKRDNPFAKPQPSPVEHTVRSLAWVLVALIFVLAIVNFLVQKGILRF